LTSGGCLSDKQAVSQAPEVHYVTAPDGVRIAYTAFGSGDGVPLVVLRSLLTSHIQAEWQLPAQTQFHEFERLARNRVLVRLDPRGAGLSDRDVADRSLAARAADIGLVVDQLGLARFAIDAFGEALRANPDDALSHTYIERCRALADDPPVDWNGVWIMTSK